MQKAVKKFICFFCSYMTYIGPAGRWLTGTL